MGEGNDAPRVERLRTAVWREFKKRAKDDPAFVRAMNEMGLFDFLDVVDAITDALIAEQNEAEPMNLRLDSAEAEIQHLRKLLDEARRLIGAAQ